MIHDVVVIGAGLAGLTAARDLQAAGLSVKVIEARSRIGGKTWTVPISSGRGCVDMGAAWINDRTQKHISKLATEFGLATVKQNTDGKVAFLDNSGKVSSFQYGELPKLSSEETEDLVSVRDLVQELCQRVNIRNWEGDRLAVLSERTMDECVKQIAQTAASSYSVQVWTRAMLGVEPHELSGLFFLDYCRSGGSLLEMRSDRSDGAQYLRFPNGTQQFATQLNARLRPGTVELSLPVIGIEQIEDRVNVTCDNGHVYTARKIIITTPSPLYATMHWNPPLPETKQVIMKETTQGYYTKDILDYDKPWWRDLGFCGLSQSFDCGPICVTRDTSDERYQWSLTCFVAGEAGRQWSLKPYYVRKEAVLDQVVKLFGSTEARKPIDVLIREWSKEEWSQGAPCPVQNTKSAMSAHKHIRTPFRNVHFAGTETAWEWKGYMDGAVSSGKRAASEIMSAFGI